MRTVETILVLLLLLSACSEKRQNDLADDVAHTSLATPTAPTLGRDSLFYLEQYIGQSPATVDLWRTEPLHSQLRQLLGKSYPIFEQTMQQAQPLRKERVLYTFGATSDQAGNRLCILLIDVENNKLHVSLVNEGERKQFQTPGEDLYIPQEIEHLLRQRLQQ
jgi:hypothetical protein